ncbi:hypothetical protein D3C79_907460 [compost metagenome]
MPPIAVFAFKAVAVAGAADVGEHAHQFSDLRPKMAFDIAERCGCIFYRVVQPGRGQHFFTVRHATDDFHHCLRVNNVGIIGVFAALVDRRMRFGGVTACTLCQCVCHVLSLRTAPCCGIPCIEKCSTSRKK